MINSILDILKTKHYLDHKLGDNHVQQLEENGFCLLPPDKKRWDWIGAEPDEIRKIIDSLLEKEGIAAGSEGKEEISLKINTSVEQRATRLGNLLNKNKIFRKIATLPETLWGSFSVIDDNLKLSAIIFRQPDYNSKEQELHIDWNPRRSEKEKYHMATTFLYLEDSHKNNGATILVPASHKKLGYPCEYVNPFIKNSNEYVIEASKGSLLIINSLVWHKGGNNVSGETRGGVITEYRDRYSKQLLNLKKYIDSSVKKTFTKEELYLFGLRDIDFNQIEKSYGSGPIYRKWLKSHPQYDYRPKQK